MGTRSKREYTEAVHLRYKNATRQGKTAILDEFCATMADGTARAMDANHDTGKPDKPAVSPSRRTQNRGFPDSVTLFAEHGLQEIRHPRCRIGPYLLLFLSYHKKEAVQGFVGHIVVKIH
jgi:hypothetical protein